MPNNIVSRFCACGREFKPRFASTTKCPLCEKKSKSKKDESAILTKPLYCRRCGKVTTHSRAGTYSKETFFKCKCGAWRREDSQGPRGHQVWA